VTVIPVIFVAGLTAEVTWVLKVPSTFSEMMFAVTAELTDSPGAWAVTDIVSVVVNAGTVTFQAPVVAEAVTAVCAIPLTVRTTLEPGTAVPFTWVIPVRTGVVRIGVEVWVETAADVVIREHTVCPSTVALTVVVPASAGVNVVVFVPLVIFPANGKMLPLPLPSVNVTGMPSGTYPLAEVSRPAELYVRFAWIAEVWLLVMADGMAVAPSTSQELTVTPPETSPAAGPLLLPHQLLSAVPP
jgi:hypothetical protein